MSKEDIHVEIDGPLVTIEAEVKQHDSRNADSRMLRSERYYGAVSRSVQLPADIDRDQASAKYDKGVLLLTLPKKPQSGGKRLAIS